MSVLFHDAFSWAYQYVAETGEGVCLLLCLTVIADKKKKHRVPLQLFVLPDSVCSARIVNEPRK